MSEGKEKAKSVISPRIYPSLTFINGTGKLEIMNSQNQSSTGRETISRLLGPNLGSEDLMTSSGIFSQT